MDNKDETNDMGLTQDAWIARVNSIVEKHYGVDVYDILGDFNSWEPWNDGVSPEDYYNDDLKFELEEAAESMLEMGEALGL